MNHKEVLLFYLKRSSMYKEDFCANSFLRQNINLSLSINDVASLIKVVLENFLKFLLRIPCLLFKYFKIKTHISNFWGIFIDGPIHALFETNFIQFQFKLSKLFLEPIFDSIIYGQANYEGSTNFLFKS